MTLPNYLSTFTLTFGPYSTLTGGESLMVGMKGVLAVSPAMVDSISGAAVLDSISFVIGNDGTATVGPLVHNDDPAINQGTQYSVTWQALSYKLTPGNKTFVVPVASGAQVDYDLLSSTSGTPSGPYALPLVTSVNGHSGAVTLTATDVGADAAGAATAAQAAAIVAAATDASSRVTAEVARADGKYVATTGLDAATAPLVTGSGTTATALRAAFDAGSKPWLQAVAGAFGFSFTSLTTVDSATGLPTAAAVKWPDGTTGTFTGTTDGSNGYTSYTVTWAGGTTKTVSASGITYDTATGIALGPTTLAVA